MNRSRLFALLLALWAASVTATLAAQAPSPATAVIVEAAEDAAEG